MTLIPAASYATIDQTRGCSRYMTSFVKCEGELNGRTYRWTQENLIPNYVLFMLIGKASISKVNLTYSVDSTSELPKVSFCAAPNDTNIHYYIPNLTCQVVSIEATGGDTRAMTLHVPFTNITNTIVMEVDTLGVKASFKARAVQFFGFYAVTGEYTHNFTYLPLKVALYPGLPEFSFFFFEIWYLHFIGLQGLHYRVLPSSFKPVW